MFEYSPDPAPLDTTVRVILLVWCGLLVPWFPFAMLSGLAFDGGYTINAYAFVWSFLSYPILLGIAFYYRRKQPKLIWLPLLSLFAIMTAIAFDEIGRGRLTVLY